MVGQNRSFCIIRFYVDSTYYFFTVASIARFNSNNIYIFYQMEFLYENREKVDEFRFMNKSKHF